MSRTSFDLMLLLTLVVIVATVVLVFVKSCGRVQLERECSERCAPVRGYLTPDGCVCEESPR